MEKTKRIRPTATERRQVNSKLSHEAFDWADSIRWDIKCTFSNLINKSVEFAMNNEKEFIEFYNDIPKK